MVFTRTSCTVRTGKSGILFSIPLFFLRRVCYNGASIMKKVHSAGFRPVTFVHFCHHTPQGDVNMGTIKNATGGDEPTHTPQGDKQTEGTFLHCIDAAEKFLLLF